MSGIIRVTPAELMDMSNRYSGESSQVEDQIGRLDTMIRDLESMWEGESSRAFNEQYQTLRPSFVQMQQLLQDISEQLNSTAQALENADQQIASQIRG
ncbi:WXG100 family type VII secretion target [Metabacillus litoralis]|uniref:ESAT-6-like protein n=1 Tax=Metabacillus litoralis TaxID=152268 RepID=A0A5C6VY52_9BACI|nr:MULTISPECIES: WXG100 family type VII secretion target [Metabacillus]MBM7605168.1 WXG100 family type VII secretion target [Metabacillus crassostreae]TXC89534.1 WXG100 family type VII secretion target [Metabacillus litoralis]